jgi:hypothetical protein
MMRISILCLGFLVALSLQVSTLAVAAQQEETVCIQCHGGLPDALGAPVAAWRESIHAANGISCHDCHGGDPTDFAMAMSPERGFIGVPEYVEVPEFCGRCHVGVLEDYQKSAHGLALHNGGAQCVVCHSNHAVQKASLDLINPDSCSRCHSYDRAEEIKGILADTDGRIGTMETDLTKLGKLGMDVEALQGQLFDLRNRFHRAFHTVKVERVKAQTGEVLGDLDQLREKVSEINARLGQRKLWGGVAIGLLVLAGILFLLMRKSYEEQEKG